MTSGPDPARSPASIPAQGSDAIDRTTGDEPVSHTTIRSAATLALALAAGVAASGAVAQNLGSDFGAKGADNAGSIELVDPKVLRVCADPNNLPFSNEKGEGFENKIAALLAARLHKDLAYAFYPGATGFVRNTLNAHLCDVILGMPQGNDLVQPTNPYYRTTYAIVTRAGSELDGMTSLDDPRLKEKPHRIGLVARTPPGNILARNGLMASVKPYPLMVDTRVESSSAAMIHDLETGDIDVALLWGPIAGYYARKTTAKLSVTPLAETPGARMAFRIAFGVRHSDQNWKRELNTLIAQNKADIDKILIDYGVPMLDESGQPARTAAP
jgi:quinoprotein dehydrogenase-associated probable ABC transporter substrate-binding protein